MVLPVNLYIFSTFSTLQSFKSHSKIFVKIVVDSCCDIKLPCNIRKSLKSAKKANESHVGEIRELEKELEAIEAKRLEYEERIEEESQSQGRDLELEESQVIQLDLFTKGHFI